MTTREEFNTKIILEEYRAAGVEPVRMPDGRLVSLTLARQNASGFGLKLVLTDQDAAE